jgi:hypothetical protein
VDYQFDDGNSTDVINAINGGSATAVWSFGLGKVQDGNYNYGYTKYYSFENVDISSNDAGTNAYRVLEFANSLTTSDMTDYIFTVEFSAWDLSRAWDTTSDSAAGKGIQFSLDGVTYEDGTTTSSAVVGFETVVVDGGFGAFAGGSSGTDYLVGDPSDNSNTWLERVSDSGGVLQINGNLQTGDWSAQVRENVESSDWSIIKTGEGVTAIESISIAARNPADGSWGGSADDVDVAAFTGDFMLIDSFTLTSVPELSSYALLAGMLALASVMVRRRQ